VTVSTGGVITGFNFVPGAAATMTSPTSVPLHLLALEQAAQPGTFTDLAVGGDSTARVTSDAQLRAAIVNVAGYYLRLAKTRTPAQMEALIWEKTSSDGADHGESCAAFASLTLELAAQAAGQQSWVTGGESYPWPMPEWADLRVNTNPASPGITSLVADAQAHERWHPLGDGYQPQPGDWAIYDEHVEVVTSYARGVLDTIGADSLPGLTVNAHSSGAPLADQGVEGFVDNGNLKAAAGAAASSAPAASQAPAAAPAASQPAGGTASAGQPAPATAPRSASSGHSASRAAAPARDGSAAAIPGILDAGAIRSAGASPATGPAPQPGGTRAGAAESATVPGVLAAGDLLRGAGAVTGGSAGTGTSTKAPAAARPAAAPSAQPAHEAPPSSPAAAPATAPATSAGRQYATPGTRDQQAFISLVAPGAIAAQQRFGVPAAVTIAQAIEESAWGRSGLAAQYHNLFGIKGTGPAGGVSLPTAEYQGGQWVTVDARFRVYHNDAESIADHAELLATSGYYTRAMADRAVPDAFANDLTGVYATDPDYGANLVALMKLYNLYQFDAPGAPAPAPGPATAPTRAASPAASPAGHQAAVPAPGASDHSAPAPASPAAGHNPATPASGPAAAAAGQAGNGHAGQQVTGHAHVPGVAAPALAPSVPALTSAGTSAAAAGHIPGLVSPGPLAPVTTSAGPARVAPARGTQARGATATSRATVAPHGGTQAAGTGGARVPGLAVPGAGARPGPAATPVRPAGTRGAGPAAATAPRRGSAQVPGVATSNGIVTTARITRGQAVKGPARYQPQLPHAVTTAMFATAKAPLARGEHLYRDVAACTGISWELLAAVDWMQCKADPRYSPVHGEKIGSLNDDGTSYSTKSAALIQCACDLIELAAAVYGTDLTARRRLSVRELAAAFAAFRWGALLRRHGVSAMEFPYSVAGLTPQHQKMHWPSIDAPGAPDRPGGRFREPFGAVPVVLSLDYPATV
jgi:flagellum-specific peptidoglycan hydrolase FlgJ